MGPMLTDSFATGWGLTFQPLTAALCLLAGLAFGLLATEITHYAGGLVSAGLITLRALFLLMLTQLAIYGGDRLAERVHRLSEGHDAAEAALSAVLLAGVFPGALLGQALGRRFWPRRDGP